ncbi:MAG: hypothetical protein GY792_04205, partial [Gammaproteobacteria bacterium]|nr:hypothetical protein [Gammaproteobacteria bacterium]
MEKFSVTSGTKNLAEAESRTVDKERRFLQSSFSAVYRLVETVRARLEVLQLTHDRIEAYLAEHRQRIEALEIRLKDGKEISIHDKAFIKRELNMYLPGNLSGGEESATVRKTEADLLKGQIVGVLKAIQPSSNCHIALAEQECPLRFQLAGDTAFFAFDLPESRDKLPFERDELEALAWTTHPDIIYRLRNEFEAMWQAIDPQWRTDTEEGRKNVVNFIVVESLKAMLKENVPGH